MRLIIEVLDKSDKKLRTQINENIQTFADMIIDNTQSKGIKWDDITLKFEQLAENKRITEYTNHSTVFS